MNAKYEIGKELLYNKRIHLSPFFIGILCTFFMISCIHSDNMDDSKIDDFSAVYFGKQLDKIEMQKVALYVDNSTCIANAMNDGSKFYNDMVAVLTSDNIGEYYSIKGKDIISAKGKGIEYYKNGNKRYEGDFVNNKYEGNGTYYKENGTYYIGEFKNGHFNGKGIIYYKNGKIRFDGTFINGRYEGAGKLYYDDDENHIAIIGEYKNGLLNGKAKTYYKNGNLLYDGDWVNGKKQGYGKLFFENGNLKYEGEFFNNKRGGKETKKDENEITPNTPNNFSDEEAADAIFV